jgi:hypothetical protein
MDKFLGAIEEVKAELLAGSTEHDAIVNIAAEHDLPELALRNRATKALGELSSYAERQREFRIAEEQGLKTIAESARIAARKAKVEGSNVIEAQGSKTRTLIDIERDYMRAMRKLLKALK